MKKWGRPAGLIVVQRDSKLPYTAALELVQTHSTLQCWSPCDSNRIKTFETHQTHLKPPNSAGLTSGSNMAAEADLQDEDPKEIWKKEGQCS